VLLRVSVAIVFFVISISSALSRAASGVDQRLTDLLIYYHIDNICQALFPERKGIGDNQSISASEDQSRTKRDEAR